MHATPFVHIDDALQVCGIFLLGWRAHYYKLHTRCLIMDDSIAYRQLPSEHLSSICGPGVY